MSNSIKNIMADDHRYCDNLLIQLDEQIINTNWLLAEKHLGQIADNINYHFKHEEQVLFPWFESATNSTTGPSMVMRNEHQQIRELLTDLEQSIQKKNEQRYFGLSESLNIFIQQHNIKEEGILYPMIEDLCANNIEPLIKAMINHQQLRAT